MPPISLCWPTWEAAVGVMVAEVEPSHPLCFVAVWQMAAEGHWQNDVWHGSVCGAKVCQWAPLCRKNGTHWHSSTFAEQWWRPSSVCERSEGGGSDVKDKPCSTRLCRLPWAQHTALVMVVEVHSWGRWWHDFEISEGLSQPECQLAAARSLGGVKSEVLLSVLCLSRWI